jgi:hypothetical protein
MAENESLDLYSRHAQRWSAVRDAALKGGSCRKVGAVTRTKLFGAIRKARKEFLSNGVSIGDFLAARGEPRKLRNFLQATKRHEYAELLVTVLDSYPEASDSECLKQWLGAVLGKMLGQIAHNVLDSERFPSAFATLMFFEDVQEGLEGDLTDMADKLAANPDCPLRQRTKAGEPRPDPTADLITMSLAGGPKR